MKNSITEEKKTFSFDKNFSLNILCARPDKYKQLEGISRDYDEIINTGSNLSYSPLGINQNGVSLEFKNLIELLILTKMRRT